MSQSESGLVGQPSKILAAVRESGPQARPWARFWARQLDLVFARLLFPIVLGAFGFSFENMNELVLGLACVFAWVPMEGLLLSVWGFTPGKWLLKIRVTMETGERLSLPHALLRSFRVWYAGIGGGVPLIAVATAWVQYSELTKSGLTTYDRKGNLGVHHQIIGGKRLALVGLVLFGYLVLAALGVALREA